MSDPQIENLDAIVEHLTESMDVAMKAEGIDAETRETIITAVGEGVGNNAEILLPYVKEESVEE